MKGFEDGALTWAEVDLSAIRYNVESFRQLTRDAEIMAVVKADGYGHGAVPVAKAALEAGARRLAVARLEEGLALRKAGIRVPILLLGWIDPGTARELVAADLEVAVFDPAHIPPLAAAARELHKRAGVHIKIDTGMGRIGWRDTDQALKWAVELNKVPEVEIRGTFTHFAAADAEDLTHARGQWRRFDHWVKALESQGMRPPLIHAANTAAALSLPEAHYDALRVGIGLYGYLPNPGWKGPVVLRPALRWMARLVYVKWVEPGATVSYGCTYRAPARRRIGTVAVGYGDGLRRGLSNAGYMLVHGRRAPIVGRVCMDQTMIDLTNIPEARSGDVVTVLGRDGEETWTADNHARLLDTISYEILCGIGKRVPRRYV
ncbi:alanine racemase [Kyrpidia spormannii]|uniref:Alanine racemase n=2 Tax=Kyrpidia spormannii TaxID=2055160 RepID=A0ACA8ZCJ8_9BACL|nr:alanine racemase [Kyrpidia spormannii]CAB3395218.1 Alanine racemase [Kyrpidia spormannii]CAB3396036.1 Alanine racemase [Kyrpidia spormannii]